jgi:hypothetical protein
VAVAALYAGIVSPFAPPSPPDAAEMKNARPVNRLFGEEMELIAVRWEAEAGAPSLTLYWQARRPIRRDLRTALRLLDARDNLIWEWKRSPGAGRFSTDRWPPGWIVADAYRIPQAALKAMARAEVGVYTFPEGDLLPLKDEAGSGPFLTLYHATP